MSRVMIVNDSSLEGRILLDLLSRRGYQVGIARDGIDALTMVKTFQPDVIISDIVLPRMSGLDMVRRLKEAVEDYDIPVIFASSSDAKHDRLECLKAGGSDYIQKPIDHEELVLRVEVALRHKTSIDSLKRREGILRAGSLRDPLTGLYNRRYFDQKMAEELARVDRYGSILTLIMLDIDHFKRINDNYGHLVGDKVLITMAGRLKLNVRATDTVCRFGGEEFAIIAAETDLKGAFALAEKMRETVANEPFFVADGKTLSVTSSFGISQCSRINETSQTLIDRADKALYEAKKCGRNRVEWLG
ncbi:diguanylate cyclase [Heliobacterium gestii]|uniref:Stage 0 sporulation protein A homolog n=1 Tax=Heliomicrobium gestii TaxID=2699 RepID=A0A845LDC3_HELGE|nr:diguanylate cyclase [Heliomicrobium gestii]MBM7868176.1 diguanylate cyclase (GGDEF)-like protein [Heliomicrobium gestii]MZP43374.1 diguanylate cyclase [Heliomicrobium gestii]